MLTSCLHEPVIPDTPAVSFATDVQPVIIGNCTQSGCHSDHGGEFPLITYDDVSATVSPGNSRSSALYTTVTGRAKLMPPSPQPMLTDPQIRFIYLWIEQGAKNN